MERQKENYILSSVLNVEFFTYAKIVTMFKFALDGVARKKIKSVYGHLVSQNKTPFNVV